MKIQNRCVRLRGCVAAASLIAMLCLSAAVAAAQTFVRCEGPSSPGVSICSPPNGLTVSSPFVISAGGMNTNGTDGMDVWLDGTKLGFFPTVAVNIANATAISGSHRLDIFAVGRDGELQLTSSFFIVSGGGGCPAPASPGVNICVPANGTPVTSPFEISAAGMNTNGTAGLDVWLDGAKVGFFGNTNVRILGDNRQFFAAAGPHRLDIFAVGLDGELQLTSSFFTVVPAAACPIPGSPAVNICAPANGSSVNPPLTISAAGKNTNGTDGMDVWLDGTKISFFANTTTVNINNLSGFGPLPSNPGMHQLDIFAVGVDGELILQSSFFNLNGGCATPDSPGVNICSPSPAFVPSCPVEFCPVSIRAVGRNNTATAGMDVWFDGTKLGFFPGNTVDTSVPTSRGHSHQLDIYAVGIDGELELTTLRFFEAVP